MSSRLTEEAFPLNRLMSNKGVRNKEQRRHALRLRRQDRNALVFSPNGPSQCFLFLPFHYTNRQIDDQLGRKVENAY